MPQQRTCDGTTRVRTPEFCEPTTRTRVREVSRRSDPHPGEGGSSYHSGNRRDPRRGARRDASCPPQTAQEGLYPIVLNPAKWRRAIDLREGDYLCMPHLYKRVADTVDLRPYIKQGVDRLGRPFGNRAVKDIPVTSDFAWLLGLYVAEGSASPAVCFSLGSHEVDLVDRVASVAAKIGYSASRCLNLEKHTCQVNLGGVVIGRWLKEVCGPRAQEKRVPAFVLRHPDATIRRSFIEGLVDGDGYRAIGRPQPTWVVATSSRATHAGSRSPCRTGRHGWIHPS